jgi:hypothetical protein
VILLSLILVIAAAVLLVVGVFQDGLLLIYLSIASCLMAMALLGIGVLLRRKQGAGEPAIAGHEASAATATAGETPSAPAVTGRPVGTRRSAEVEEMPNGDATAEQRPVEDAGSGEMMSTDAAVAEDTPRASGTVLPAPTARNAAPRKVAVKRTGVPATTAEKTAVKKAVVRRPASTSSTSSMATAGGTTSPAARTELPAVKGLGPAKRDALLARFGDAEGVRRASVEELTEVRGIGPALARAVKDALG